jgi:hypothetical protein
MITVETLQQRLDDSPVSCNSFVIVHRDTGKAVIETYSLEIAAVVNTDKYEVLTALEWLQRFNRTVKILDKE